MDYLQAIRDALPDDGIFVDEITQVGFASWYGFPVYQPRTFISSGYCGNLGFGYPTSLGVKIANPDKQVVAIAGDGFFEVQMPGGFQGYTRDGSFKVSADGAVVTNEGYQVVNAIPNIGAEVSNVAISKTGEYTLFDQQGQNIGAGQIQTTRFINPSGLQNIGGNIYQETPASGVPEQGNPGQNGFGELAQGYLEMSNVKVVEEMVNLIKAQRAYEVNSKAIQAADEMMQRSNNIKR